MDNPLKTSKFNTKASVNKAKQRDSNINQWTLVTEGKTFSWANRLERIELVRKGIPYGALETVGKKINSSVKQMLQIVGVPQTTYNKKKGSELMLDSRDSELVLRISELIDFGQDVFNNEHEKFERWLNHPNLSMGGVAPISLLDTISGINEVTNALNRIEYGNFA